MISVSSIDPWKGGSKRSILARITPRDFSSDFFRFLRNQKKSLEKSLFLKNIFFERLFSVSKKPKKVARKIPGKWVIIGRFEPAFHGFVDLGLLYRSVKGRFKTEYFGPLYGRVPTSSIFRFLPTPLNPLVFTPPRVRGTVNTGRASWAAWSCGAGPQ